MQINKFDDSPMAQGYFIDALETIAKRIPYYFTPLQNKENVTLAKSCEFDCTIEWFYYYDSTVSNKQAYKNGLWLRINRNNDLWIFTSVNEPENIHVEIITKENLKCKNFPQTQSNLIQLPPHFSGSFLFKEDNSNENITYETLMQEIMNRLKCICKHK